MEEENQVSPQQNDSENDNTIENVINQGVYGLTGVRDALSKSNEDENQAEPDTNENETKGALEPLTNKLGSIIQNENNENQYEEEEEEEEEADDLPNQSVSETNDKEDNVENPVQYTSAENDTLPQLDESNDQSQIEPGSLDNLAADIGAGLIPDNNDDISNPIDNDDSNEQNQNEQGSLDNLTTEVAANLLPDNNDDASNPVDNEESNEQNQNEQGSLDNLTTEIGAGLLPDNNDDISNPIDNEESNEQNQNEQGSLENIAADIGSNLLPDNNEAANENKDDNEADNENNEDKEADNENKDDNEAADENNEDKEASNESNEDKEADNENNEDKEADNENNEDNDSVETEGMTVNDEFKDSYSGWKSDSPPRVPGSHSVDHLPPLETTPEQDSASQRFLERFEKRGKLPDPVYYSQVLQYIQRQKINAVISNDFVSAGRYQAVTQKLLTAINSTNQNVNQKKKLDLLEQKLEHTNNELYDFKHETDELIKNKRYLLTDKRAQLVNIQEESINNFEDHWNDEDFLMKYAKPSSELLQAKKIERSFVLAKDFEGAEDCRKKVTEMEKFESQEAQRRARSEMEKQYKKMTVKHEEEIQAFDEYAKGQLDLLSRDRSNKLEKLVARQTKLQSQIFDIKNPGRQSWTSASGPLNQNQKGISLGTSLPSLNYGKGNKVDMIMTPRTIQRYALYKTTMKQPKLTVKPLGSINRKRKEVQAPKF